MSETQVTQADFLDASGNVVISMDGKGNILGGSAAFKDTADTSADTPADTTSPVDTTAPAADKGSPDTGVEGVAAVAGAAVLAAGAVVLSRKRK